MTHPLVLASAQALNPETLKDLALPLHMWPQVPSEEVWGSCCFTHSPWDSGPCPGAQDVGCGSEAGQKMSQEAKRMESLLSQGTWRLPGPQRGRLGGEGAAGGHRGLTRESKVEN